METQPLLTKKGWLRALLFFFSFFIIVALFDLIGILIVSQFSEYSFEEFISDPELIMQNKNNYNYNYLKAICLDKLNKWKDSKKILIKLISKNPNDAYALNYLSYSMAIRNEDLIKAKKLIKKALEIEKNNGFFLDTLGWIQFKLNDVDEAVRSLQLAIELEPNNSEIIDHLGDIYYKIGRKKEAIYEWKRALIGNADDKLKKDIKSKLDRYAQ